MGVTVAVTRVAANTSIGTQDITTSDLGGLTPKAAWIVATRAVTDGAAADGAAIYVGMTDGTNSLNQAYEDEHNQATSDVQNKTDTSSPPVLIIYDGTADDVIDGSADFSAWITNGIRINWTDAPAAAFLITVVFFAGSDLSASVLLPTSLGDTTDGATDITAIGFEPDVFISVLCFNGTGVGFTHGLVHNNRAGTVTQRCINYFERNGRTAAEMFSVVRTDYGIAEYNAGGVFDWGGEFSSFDSSGFTVTTRNAGGNSRTMGGLALRFGASPVVSSKVYTYTTPTGTGSNTDSTPGFTPQFVMYFMGRVQTAGNVESDADAGPFGFLTADADDVYSNTVASEDAAADTNTQSLSDDYLVLTGHTGTLAHEATLTSFGATGPVWNWAGTDGTARLWAALAIEAFSSGGATDLTVADATHAHASDSIALTANAHLAITDGAHVHASDAIALVVSAFVAVQDAAHTHAADSIALTVAAALSANDATHAHTADSIALVAQSTLAITDATHEHATDGIALTATAILSINDATHEHAVDSIDLTTEGSTTLAINDAAHAHATDSIALATNNHLTIADASHEHTTDAIALAANNVLSVQDATHTHTTDAITLTPLIYLVVTDARHENVADGIALVSNSYLAITDATHLHVADVVTLAFPSDVEPVELHLYARSLDFTLDTRSTDLTTHARVRALEEA